ncbi:MAG: sn-glycerol-3-phosphate ABC transporter substrate-binding protein UgpB [Advenella sp.]|uniref:sn-glycerol-3-phosphate ABC transporter substrate-binding protein UgpB n=1 Tax=unclassified Advenella TaxID=2685285 RepID=UPI00145F0AF1|nr:MULTISPECIES: sn-glycerol-3-phosphate ABC transporter substrate-binding protein UgpB [unclassified Advenella]MDD3757870.1 sn-glycerol-3-phosphate ABC transporter substrate-binding protein UgpB [Advenella sp.]
MQIKKSAMILGSIFALTSFSTHAATEITFWHSMEGPLGERVNEIVNDFNQKQTDYKIKPTYKGAYGESMNAGIAAYRAGQAPDIIQVFEVGTATMMFSKGAIKPIQEMSEEAGNPIDPKNFVPGIAGYYSEPNGKLASMPFNSSTPVFYYNKDMFEKAGLDPNSPPKTYAQIHEAAKKLKEAGIECGYTTAWPSWVLVENFSALHNLPYATKNNGFDGLDARIELNKEGFVKHFKFLNEMAKDGTFTYGGRGDAANALFSSGKCAMFTGSSGSRANFSKNAPFKFGISTLPYYDDVPGAPQNSVIGGASLWVFNNKSPEVNKGITEFFQYISSPEVAAKWHQDTGYVPVVKAAYDLTKESGFYDKNPGTDVPFIQLNVETTDESRGVRLGFLPQIRDIQDAEMENIFAQKVSVEEGLENMQKRANELLQRFENSNK